MIRLIPTPEGTHFQCYFSQPSTETPPGLREQLEFLATEGYKNLAPGIAGDIASGRVKLS